MNPRPDATTLNAYVDGELSPREAAGVAAAVAEDPGLARTVAQLHALKNAVHSAYEDLPDSPIKIDAPSPKRGRAGHWAMAAAVAVGLLLPALWLVEQPAGNATLAEALAAHDRWATVAKAQVRPRPDDRQMAIAARATPLDLSPAGLQAVRVDHTVRLAGHPATQIAYRGRRGCRLSLFVMPGQAPLEDIIGDAKEDGVLADAWTAPGRSYLLVARRMNRDRFAVLSTALREATMLQQRDAGDSGSQVALGSARQPCLA